ncbi:MAG: hypothetical protein RJA99_4841 [Pseudomonadota bacterium]|jgi:hypothetical protein
MKRRQFACVAIAGSLLAGCAATPRYDATFGEAVRQARALQVLNPDAGRDGDTLPGIDGRAGRAAVERYQSSFKDPVPTFEVLNIGGIATGSGR